MTVNRASGRDEAYGVSDEIITGPLHNNYTIHAPDFAAGPVVAIA